MRHAERQWFGLSLASQLVLGRSPYCRRSLSTVDAPRGSCFSSRSTRGRLTTGCEGRTPQRWRNPRRSSMGFAPRKSGSQRTPRWRAGGRWIRTFGSRTRHQAVRPRRGRFPVIGISPHRPAGPGILNLRPLARWFSALEREQFQGHRQKTKAQIGGLSRAEPKVRIHLPPAWSPLCEPET
jgi:hypothetical protein